MTGLLAKLHPFRLALRSPLVTGGVSIRFRAGFLVSLEADGIIGWGETSPLPGWSRNTLLRAEAALRLAIAVIDSGGEDAVDVLAGSLDHAPHARAGFAGAWADLQARRAGSTLAAYLAAGSTNAPASPLAVNALTAEPEPCPQGSVALSASDAVAVNALTAEPEPCPQGSVALSASDAVAVNALVAAPEPSEVEQAVRDAANTGFRAVKLKVGSTAPAVDVERVRAARAGLGPEAELRLDANGAWDPATALDVLSRVHDCDVAYCEEPVAGVEAIAAVGRRSPIPVATDESIRSEADAVRALGLGIGTLIVKPQALGGPDVALSVAARAHEAGASVVVTSFLDSAVGLTHALHVAAAVDAAAPHRRAHGLATAGLLAVDVGEAPPVVAGTMAVPAAEGLGIAPETDVSPISAL